jgi:hypothetical protein
VTTGALVRAWWVGPAVSLIGLALVVAAWNGQRLARSEAERAREAAELARVGVSVAADATERQLRVRLADLTETSHALAEELARVQAATPGARPVAVASGTTGPTPAGGALRPGWPCAPVAPCSQPAESGTPTTVAPPSACLLSAGDQGEVRVEGAALRTRAGNAVVVGAASAWRVSPGPAARLFGGPLHLEVSVAAPARPLGWGVGLMASAGSGGVVVGPMLSPPPWSVLGLQVEVFAGGGVGPAGDWTAAASLLVRR